MRIMYCMVGHLSEHIHNTTVINRARECVVRLIRFGQVF